jgi:uncharacterized phage protein gp47/JayE
MTFVAQPYERFADDLLTALTGGVVRQEFEFIGVDQSYVLAHPNVIAASVDVFGQRNETYAIFVPGTDYRYDATMQAIMWEPRGQSPDDHSFFYASYYLQESQPQLTDRNPGSVTTVLASAFAREFAVLHKQMEMIYDSAFVDLANGNALDHIAALLALTRKDAKFASGEVLFKRTTPASGDITIPVGTLISTAQGQNFETTDKRTLRKGQLSVTAPIRAQVEGPAGRVDATAINTVNRPIFGIEAVVNEQPAFFATARETDDELRRRIKGTLERAGRSTVEAIKYNVIENVPQISEANIQVREDPNVPGRVEVRLGASGSDPEMVRRVEAAIFEARPAGVRVLHNLATRTPTVAANGSTSRAQVLADFRAVGAPEPPAQTSDGVSAQDATLPLHVEILLTLAERNLAVAEKEKIEDDVRAAVVDYVRQLPMGALLVYNKLLARIVQPDAIADASLLIKQAAAPADAPAYRTNLDTQGRKATAETTDVFVELAEQIVYIDVRILLQAPRTNGQPPAPGQTAGPPPMPPAPQITQALKDAVKATVERVLSAERTITQDGLRQAIAETVAQIGGGLILAEANAVTLNAEYEETGRLLNNTAQVALAPQEVARLRDPQAASQKGNPLVELIGALDG